MSSVVKRIVTGTTIGVLVIAIVYFRDEAEPGFVAWCASTILATLGAWELGRMEGFRALRLSPALPLASILVAIPAWLARDELSRPDQPFLVILAGAVIAAIVAAALVPRARALAIGLAVWCAVPMYGFVSIDLVYGTAGLASVIVLSKIGDIFGYFVGRAIGERHPFPNLSPGKTVAGCVASLVSGVVAGVALALLGHFPDPSASPLIGAVIGLVLNLAAQLGDLLESKVKRVANVKDSSGLAGASGGILDVIDSTLLTVPVALLLWPLMFD